MEQKSIAKQEVVVSVTERTSEMRKRIQEEREWAVTFWETFLEEKKLALRYIHERCIEINRRAVSLTYTSLWATAPLLVLCFSVLHSLGVPNQLEPLLLEFFRPLGTQKHEIVRHITESAKNLNPETPTILIAIILVFFSLTLKVERAYNYIWHLDSIRSLRRRLGDYMGVVLVVPLLIYVGLILAHSMSNSSEFGWLIRPFRPWLSYLLICAGFIFLHKFVPTLKVNFSAAIVGGIFSFVLWFIASLIFINFFANSFRLSVTFGSFVSFVLFIFWVYVTWLIILAGGKIAFLIQHRELYKAPTLLREELTNHDREEIAIELMLLIGEGTEDQKPLLKFNELAQKANLLPDKLQEILEHLKKKELIERTGDNLSNWEYRLPHRSNEIKIKDILNALRGEDNTNISPVVDDLMQDIDSAIAKAVGDRTLEDLINSKKTTS